MKARDARRNFIVKVALAFVGVFTCSAIIGVTAVTPFIYTKVSELMAKAKANHKEGIPAAKAAKAKMDALKKEQAKLEKDKKALEKKKLAARKAQAQKIYEERVANGYESSLDLVRSEAKVAIGENVASDASTKKSAKPKKEKRSKQEKSAPVVIAPVAESEPVHIESADDYSSNGSMFRGLSF